LTHAVIILCDFNPNYSFFEGSVVFNYIMPSLVYFHLCRERTSMEYLVLLIFSE